MRNYSMRNFEHSVRIIGMIGSKFVYASDNRGIDRVARAEVRLRERQSGNRSSGASRSPQCKKQRLARRPKYLLPAPPIAMSD